MNVITTIKGYGNYLWVDVVAQIDTMSEEVAAFQNQCKRLPKVRTPSTAPPQPYCICGVNASAEKLHHWIYCTASLRSVCALCHAIDRQNIGSHAHS